MCWAAGGYAAIGIDVAVGVGSVVLLAGSGLEIYGVPTGALIVVPGVATLLVPSKEERAFATYQRLEAEGT